MKINLTYNLVLRAAEAAVEYRGAGYVYTNPIGNRDKCYYVHPFEDGVKVPGCIVGWILDSLGIDISGLDAVGTADIVLPHLMQSGVIGGYEKEAAHFLHALQRKQDGGLSWGEAFHGSKLGW